MLSNRPPPSGWHLIPRGSAHASDHMHLRQPPRPVATCTGRGRIGDTSTYHLRCISQRSASPTNLVGPTRAQAAPQHCHPIRRKGLRRTEATHWRRLDLSRAHAFCPQRSLPPSTFISAPDVCVKSPVRRIDLSLASFVAPQFPHLQKAHESPRMATFRDSSTSPCVRSVVSGGGGSGPIVWAAPLAGGRHPRLRHFVLG